MGSQKGTRRGIRPERVYPPPPPKEQDGIINILIRLWTIHTNRRGMAGGPSYLRMRVENTERPGNPTVRRAQ